LGLTALISAFALLAVAVSYGVLIRFAADEPTHPGALIALVLSVLVYALAVYALEPPTRLLAIIRLAVGALLIIKVNVGLFAAAGVVIAFVVGNSRYTKSWRMFVTAGGVLLTVALMTQQLYQVSTAEYAMLVSLVIAFTYASMHVAVVSVPRRGVPVIAVSALVTVVVSML